MRNPIGLVRVLGVDVDCVDLSAMLELVTCWSREAELRNVYYVNAHCLNLGVRNERYRQIINAGDLVYSDGISVVWAGRLLGGCGLHKMTGADWIEQFCQCAQANRLRVSILAGKPGVAEEARRKLQARYPQLQIVGAYDGFFQDRSEAEVLEDIARTLPHVLLVGRGTPCQEEWIVRHRQEIPAPVCWAVGALFDYVAGLEPRAPQWMKALALEWLWRWMMDPIGKWKRYFIGNPLFVFRVLRQKFGEG